MVRMAIQEIMPASPAPWHRSPAGHRIIIVSWPAPKALLPAPPLPAPSALAPTLQCPRLFKRRVRDARHRQWSTAPVDGRPSPSRRGMKKWLTSWHGTSLQGVSWWRGSDRCRKGGGVARSAATRRLPAFRANRLVPRPWRWPTIAGTAALC